MKLYLVRHAESESNASRTLQPHDSLLSDNGIEQAKSVAERFRHIAVNRIITSPFTRAVHTAEEIRKVTYAQVTHEKLIQNRKRPSETLGMSYEDPKLREIEIEIRTHAEDPAWHFSDEENFSNIKKRIQAFINSLDECGEETIVVVTHSVIVRLIVGLFLFGDELTATFFDTFHTHTSIANTGLTLCEKKDDRGWRLLTWNDYAHLGE